MLVYRPMGYTIVAHMVQNKKLVCIIQTIKNVLPATSINGNKEKLVSRYCIKKCRPNKWLSLTFPLLIIVLTIADEGKEQHVQLLLLYKYFH